MSQLENISPESVFTFTRSAYLNEFITEAKNIYEDDFDPDFYIDEYREKLDRLKELTEKLKEFFYTLRKTEDDVPAIKEQSTLIEEQFSRITDGFRMLEEYLDYREKEKILEGLVMVKNSYEAVFSAVDRIKEEEEKLEKYSKSPYVHELIRVARGVIDKGFPKEALKEKLQWMIGYCEGIEKDFRIYRNARCETDAIKGRIPEIEGALGKYREGLHLMEQFLDDDDQSRLEKGMALVREGSDTLISCHEFIQNELKGSSLKFCVKCGAENEVAAKFCKSCSAILPEASSPEGDSSAGAGFGGPSGAGGERVYTSNLVRLMDAVSDYTGGRSSKEDLLEVIEWMEEKVREALSAMQAVTHPEQFGSDEERGAYQEVQTLFEEGTVELDAALAEMKAFFHDGDEQHLQGGLEMAIEASQKLIVVQERTQYPPQQ
ncbi:MAG: zinc ribbon domain-containing protein [Candidatus Eremiobacteraeota bacterium]|nr:zinc ribbon domain-containing protein [Candidatus Eremiobacteraeota bacterium]